MPIRSYSQAMPAVTPAQLSLELSISQKRIREYLRELYGTLPEGTPRWELDVAQANLVRGRFGGDAADSPPTWTLEPGDTVRRTAIHEAYKGQEQGGISTPTSIRDIMIFTDPEKGARYGYDVFEGLREDGSYAYTGEGQYGDQQFVRGNRALRDANAAGKTIRLLRTKGVNATYVGAFATGDPTYVIETIPDLDGQPRQGIIFNLEPLDAEVDLLPAYGGELQPVTALVDYTPHPQTWTPPEFSDVIVPGLPQVGDRVVSRAEFRLQSDFGRWLEAAQTPPTRLPLRAGSTMIEPDFYVADRGWIVEAKKSTARGHIRTAIGQVLDYVHIASKAGLTASPVILLPGRPESDLVELMTKLGIIVAIQTPDGFEEVNA